MKLCVLHLSDIHFHETGNQIFDRALAIASSSFTRARTADACLIAVTGDIAHGGKAGEYDVAIRFFEEIKKAIAAETGRPPC
jgi:predicted MPP superfamily phosphohydrolase